MIHFRNDYSAGACPAVLEALTATNGELTAGYGTDPYCAQAAEAIRSLCACPQAAVHFLVGGTQVNKVALGAFLRPWEAVIAPDSGHICVHETGSIESAGHKIVACPSPDGKLTPAMVEAACSAHSGEHMVAPRLVYISNTTEVGTVYSRAELEALRAVCDELGLLLYCDGARLASAITAPQADAAGFADYARLCHAFTVGGTKNGLLFGEALVVTDPALQPGLRHYMKQQGAILAKGRLLGVQFSAVLKDDVYLSMGRHANALAARLTEGLRGLGVPLAVDSPSNQVFPILPDAVLEKLAEDFTFEVQRPADDTHTCIRLVTGWSSAREDVEALLDALGGLLP